MDRLIFVFVFCFLVSCKTSTHEEYRSFKNDIWHADSVVVFEYNINDTTKLYNIDLNIRYTINYKYQNLFLFLTGSLNDTLDIKLKEKDGTPLGKGLTDIREITVNIAENKKYATRGRHDLNIEQAMRYGNEESILQLYDIKDIGLIIVENE